ncbi:MAG TPA: phosphoribosylformylglycinamidine synthase subunit PurS, partial [Phycisphaerae bacterium]|nr:phosphoribosylformylglycinamidine synthase subunit PurS [Phycisphaerae bacterium]
MTAAPGKEASFRRITVSPKQADLDSTGAAVLRDVHDLGLARVQRVSASRLFLLEGRLDGGQVERIATELLADPITERWRHQSGGNDHGLPGDGYDAAIEVHLKGGVMDPVAASTLAAIADMGIDTTGMSISTARLYRLAGLKSIDEAEFLARRLLSNDCIEDVHLTGFGRHDPRPDHLPVAPERPFELRHIPIRTLDGKALVALSRDAHLFLSLTEMRTVRDYYRKLDRDPTDLELEMIAQTWSEHCVHKTLKSEVVYEGAPLPSGSKISQKKTSGGAVRLQYGNLLKETIARATHELIDSGKARWCLSVFVDNAGVIEFDDEYGIAFKVETHNHPSAIEPYGGAATGIGGVIRDVLGCGLGAKPVANTDVFCFAPPDFPMDLLPKGVLHPRRVYKGVVAGVRDYGNRMGIPTVNGAILFDDRYLGNPLVFCGCVGLIPKNRIHKEPRPGDFVVVIGGRTGRDGIHGATFSSAELTDTHADEFSHAVQIGDAIQEKKVLDALLRAREHDGECLYTAVTDCGAGGLS